jgi:hypothetical protein
LAESHFVTVAFGQQSARSLAEREVILAAPGSEAYSFAIILEMVGS